MADLAAIGELERAMEGKCPKCGNEMVLDEPGLRNCTASDRFRCQCGHYELAVPYLRNQLAAAQADRNDLLNKLDTLQCDIASALDWKADGEPFIDIIKRHKAVIDRLPATADGVPVVPGVDSVYITDYPVTGDITECRTYSGGGGDGGWVERTNVMHCYSTRAAAEASTGSRP